MRLPENRKINIRQKKQNKNKNKKKTDLYNRKRLVPAKYKKSLIRKNKLPQKFVATRYIKEEILRSALCHFHQILSVSNVTYLFSGQSHIQ